MEETLKQILNKLDKLESKIDKLENGQVRFETKIDNIEKENKEFRQEVSNRFDKIENSLKWSGTMFITNSKTLQIIDNKLDLLRHKLEVNLKDWEYTPNPIE